MAGLFIIREYNNGKVRKKALEKKKKPEREKNGHIYLKGISSPLGGTHSIY